MAQYILLPLHQHLLVHRWLKLHLSFSAPSHSYVFGQQINTFCSGLPHETCLVYSREEASRRKRHQCCSCWQKTFIFHYFSQLLLCALRSVSAFWLIIKCNGMTKNGILLSALHQHAGPQMTSRTAGQLQSDASTDGRADRWTDRRTERGTDRRTEGKAEGQIEAQRGE